MLVNPSTASLGRCWWSETVELVTGAESNRDFRLAPVTLEEVMPV